MQTLRARPALAIILAFLALLLLTGVAYAIGRLTGFIPGIGFVQKDSLRVLAEPVSQTQDGITVSIEQVFADSERTIIIYKTEGLTITAANSQGEGGGNPFGSVQLLRLPDGSTLEESMSYSGTPEPLLDSIKTEGGWPNYVARLVYPPISSDVNELTLLIPVLQNMPIGAAAENWEIIFHLKPAPADITYAPVIEFTPVPQEVTPVAGETSTPALSNIATHSSITLQLDKVQASGLVQLVKFTQTLQHWWEEFLNYFNEGFTSAVVEGLNNAIRGTIRRAYGYHRFEHFRLHVLVEHGNLSAPHPQI